MIKCGTTGQMTGLDRGENGAVECGNKADVLGGRFDELVSRDGNALRRGWYLGSESFGARLREKIGKLARGWRRESHSGAAKREHGEQAAEQLLQAGLVALGLTAEELVLGLRATPEKAALACWVRELTTVSLRWVSERLKMGHYTNAGRGPRKMGAGDVRKTRQARSKLGTIAAEHD